MSSPTNGSVWKTSTSKNSSSSRHSNTKRKDESPPVTPDSTTEPPPRPVRQFQEGDDVFFHTDDGQHVLGTVGQIVGQACQVLFGDGTQQWASFKRIKKLTATLDAEDNTSSKEMESSKKSGNAVVPKEETTEMFCTVCGTKKKVTVSKARTLKPEGPNEFKCRKCNKLGEGSSHSRHINTLLKLPPLKGHSKVAVIPKLYCNSALPQNGITIPTASGSLSIFRHNPPQDKGSNNSKSSVSNRIVKSNQPIAGPSRIKTSKCFNCEENTERNDRIPCNLCRRFCHLSCLPLNSPPPPKGDRFWDLMCSSCGTQNNDGKSRSKVFSVRRNISSWSDVADLILSCIMVGKPNQQFFDLDTEILHFLEKNMNNLKLPRPYTISTPDDRKKFLLHAMCTSELRFVNCKDAKKRSSLWALRVDNSEQKLRQDSQVKIEAKRDKSPIYNHAHHNMTSSQNSQSSEKPGQLKSSRKQSQPIRRRADNQEEPKKGYEIPKTLEVTTTSSKNLSMSASICNLANFVQTSAVLTHHRQHVDLGRNKSDEMKSKLKRCLPTTPPEKIRRCDVKEELPTVKKLKLSFGSSKSSCRQDDSVEKEALSPVKKTSVNLEHTLERPSPSKHLSEDKTGTLTDNKPKAIKSSSIVPVPAVQIKRALEGDEDRPKKQDKPTKPKIKNLQLKANILKRSAANVSKLKISNRGRPLGSKNSLIRVRKNEVSANGNPSATSRSKALQLKAATNGNGTAVSKSASGNSYEPQQTRLSKRIMEKNIVVAERTDTISNLLASTSSSLMDAIMYGGYKMQCLPSPPKTEADQRTEFLKVYQHFRTEKQNETASILLGRSESETRSQTRRKSELFGRRKRDLNNFDSYDVVGQKMDEFGLIQYFVVWKGEEDGEIESDDEDPMDLDSVNDIEEETPQFSPLTPKCIPQEKEGETSGSCFGLFGSV